MIVIARDKDSEKSRAKQSSPLEIALLRRILSYLKIAKVEAVLQSLTFSARRASRSLTDAHFQGDIVFVTFAVTGILINKTIMKQYLILGLAIVCEVVATSFMKQSEQFTRLVPSLITVAGYAAAFYCLSVVLRTIPMGVAYAIWSGVGIVLVALVGWVAYKQHLDVPAIIGMAMIVGGVLVINLFSQAAGH